MDDRMDDEAISAAVEALDCVAEGVLVTDGQHRTRYANPAALSFLSTTWEALRGRDYREVFPGSEGTAFDALFRRSMQTRQPGVVDDHYAPLDRWFRCKATPCGAGLLVVFSDVTDERQERTRLLQDLELLQQVVDHAAVGIVLKDLDGRYLLVNRTAAAPTGVPREQTIGRTAADYYPPDIAESLRRYELEVQRSGQAIHREEIVEYRPGEPQTFLSVTFPAYDSSGRLVATGAVHTDVTRWKQAEHQLAASQQRFRDVFRSTSLGQLLMTSSGKVIEVNDAWCRMVGYSREEVLGRELTTLLQSATPWDERQHRMDAQGQEGYEREELLTRRDGTTIPVLGTVDVLDGDEDAEPLISVIVRDMTEVRGLQDRLVQAERLEAVGRLAAGISHDVNNVLAAVSGYAQLLSNAVDDPALVRHVNGIFRSVERATDLVSQLLAFSRQQHLELADVDLCDVVLDLEDMLRRLLPDGVELTIDCQQVGSVHADAAQLQQVLLNLVLNARDALPDGGRIALAVSAVELDENEHLMTGDGKMQAGCYARVTVTDDGNGMPPEVASRCFEPFFTTRRRSGGHGLGLSTAFGIARQTGGDLCVTSRLGEGTCFELLLPITRPGSEPSGVAMVVLAEDDPEVRSVVEELLTAHGHRVVSACDGAVAVELMKETDAAPDVLVTDIDMPGLDGIAVAAALRERWPNLPVLFISGARVDSADLPGRFLRKPFTGAALIAAVEVMVEEGKR